MRRTTLRLAGRLISGNYIVANAQGLVVASDLEGQFKPGSRVQDVLPGIISRESLKNEETVLWRGKEFMAVAAPVSGTGGQVIVLVRMVAMQGIKQDLLMLMFRSLAWALPVSLLAACLLARRIIRPLELLRVRTRQLARREFGDPVEIKTADEIDLLIDDLNRMSQRLAEYDQSQKGFMQKDIFLIALSGYAIPYL
ncbi:MAG: Sensor histidine kinase CssS [Pelotomaculum sp. PtaB.Bin104]|nr:MAG: Sensor histidine kinase CssS [Pelotomaculum sp. PtaB.Bin104]